MSFERIDGVLNAESVALPRLAAAVGTPFYVYSAERIRSQLGALSAALNGIPHRIHFAMKANACRGVLEVVRATGAGVDVVSGGELDRARRAGFGPDDILFGGVGKQAHELREALVGGVKVLNVESPAELALIAEIAASLGVVAPVGLRVNPEVDVENAHRFIATGEKGHKFGIPIGEALAAGQQALASPHLRLIGLDMHVGSQLLSLEAYRHGAERLVELGQALRAAGAELRFLDVGGGLPVRYRDEAAPDLAAYAGIVGGAAAALEVALLVEPGRFVIADAGMLVTKVLYRKGNGGRTTLVCDAGMTELVRPSRYDAYHHVEPVQVATGEEIVDVVGPVCETGDFLALKRPLPVVEVGALLAVHAAGAYGSVMASQYNARPKAPEVMVDGAQWAVVTTRETYDDLARHDVAAPDWRRD
ncbi:MAG: diaminopimelate decarboxylase [Gemmatimonadota bacterium]|nr:diaminopimelate decarboxylase [Gemmatimonadota bacterium]